MPIINDFVQPAVLTGFVRELDGPANYTLNGLLPDKNVGDIQAAIDIVMRNNRSASFRAYDAETPIGARDGFQRNVVRLPPVGQKTVIGEEERLLLAQLQTGGLADAPLIEAIYDDAATNTRAVLARMELARGSVLTTGQFTVVDNGLLLNATFGVPGTHFPTAATLWSDTADATPLNDILGWVDTYIDDVGEEPGQMTVSRKVYNYLLSNAEIRQLAVTVGGVPGIVTPAQLGQILAAHGLPPVVQYNTRIDYQGASTRPVPENVAIFTPQDPASLGYTAWGVTAEALELATGSNPQLLAADAPGLVGVVMRDGDPLRTWTKVAAVAMPIITDPLRLMTATVD
jgi:Phage major capsid protein E